MNRTVTGIAVVAALLGGSAALAINDYAIDDGEGEINVGLTGGSGARSLAWLNHFTGQAGLNTLTAVRGAFGDIAMGTSVTAYIWSDPNGDGDPTDAGVLTSMTSTILLPDSDSFQVFDVPDVNVGSGQSFFAGFVIQGISPSDTPARLDDDGTDSPPGTLPVGGESWIVGDTMTNITASSLGSAELPPELLDNIPPIGPGNWMVRVDAVPAPGAAGLFALGLLAARRRR